MARPVLLLDVMDTLVKDPFWSVWPAFFGEGLGELFTQHNPQAWPAFECGHTDEATFFATAFADGRTFDGEALKAQVLEGYRYLDGIEALLEELKAAGVEMHLFSNYPVWYEMLDDKLGLSRFAPWTFVSCRTGVRKPDAEAYRIPVRELGRPAGELVFVDDRERNTKAAAAEGLDAVLFESAPALRAALVARGVL